MAEYENKAPFVLVIGGPTATGKTRLSVELALTFGGEVVSADSMQIYRGMNIGTAKPTMEERRGVPHHMFDVAEPGEAFSVARYVEMASACVDEVLSRGKLPILTGGTGLYLDSLISGRTFASYVPEHTYREELRQLAQRQGSRVLWGQLREIDPEAAERIHPNDEKRLIRALEVWKESGETITEHNKRTQRIPPRYRYVVLLLGYQDRARLYTGIDRRVDEMIRQGLVEEVKGLLDQGLAEGCTAMQAIGYKEIAKALKNGESLEAAVDEVKLRSRQYAKRQLSWFRRMSQAHWLLWGEPPDFQQMLQVSTGILHEAGLQ